MWRFSVCVLRWLFGSDPGCVISPAQNCHSFLHPTVSHPASPCQRISLKISQSGLRLLLAIQCSLTSEMQNWDPNEDDRGEKNYSPLSALAQIDSVSIPGCWQRSLKKKEKRWKNESFIMPTPWPLLHMPATAFRQRHPSVFTARAMGCLQHVEEVLWLTLQLSYRKSKDWDGQVGKIAHFDMSGVDFCNVVSVFCDI